ncbi:Tripartite motif-containing protein 10 [Cichlidogyrus casuarinus]|uniref:Tripartite motif-containing protein 10 n=1 Tax=Cichlidogyrus casuarinus TaxID=1844966 RepID=A0ABD2PZ90_9PLAT
MKVRLEKPYALPCLHTYCIRPCLKAYLKNCSRNQMRPSCPVCRSTFRKSDMKPNWQISSVIKVLGVERTNDVEQTDIDDDESNNANSSKTTT